MFLRQIGGAALSAPSVMVALPVLAGDPHPRHTPDARLESPGNTAAVSVSGRPR
jgi:hypothetical protein